MTQFDTLAVTFDLAVVHIAAKPAFDDASSLKISHVRSHYVALQRE